MQPSVSVLVGEGAERRVAQTGKACTSIAWSSYDLMERAVASPEEQSVLGSGPQPRTLSGLSHSPAAPTPDLA